MSWTERPAGWRWLVPTVKLWLAALAASLVPSLRLGAQATFRTSADTQAALAASRASAGRWWIDVEFPPIAVQQGGCSGYIPTTDHVNDRAYLWNVIARFPDAIYPVDHIMQVHIQFWLPRSMPLTRARLDSALAAQRLEVEELTGEPPRAIRRLAPRRAWARLERGRLHVRVEGEAATRAFLRARSDSVTLGWCQGWLMVPYVNSPSVLR